MSCLYQFNELWQISQLIDYNNMILNYIFFYIVMNLRFNLKYVYLSGNSITIFSHKGKVR